MKVFSLGTDKANNKTNNELREHGGALMAGVDDTYILGPPEIDFAYLCRHKECVAQSNVQDKGI